VTPAGLVPLLKAKIAERWRPVACRSLRADHLGDCRVVTVVDLLTGLKSTVRMQ
jgi:hypothetical protein